MTLARTSPTAATGRIPDNRSSRRGWRALAGAVVLLSTVSCSGHHKSAQPPATSRPTTAVTVAPPAAGSPSAPATTAVASTSATATPVAEVTGEDPNLTFAVLDVRRQGEIATLDFTLTSAAGTKPAIQPYALHDKQSRRNDFSGASLVDSAAGKRYLAVFDTSGDCLCSDIPYDTPLWSGKPVKLYVEFPAPPASTTKVQVDLPTFPPIDNVPITDQG